MGKTIMVSSHILPELADICNKVGIIERGELIVNDTVAEVLKQVRPHTVLNIGVAATAVGRGEVACAAQRRRSMSTPGPRIILRSRSPNGQSARLQRAGDACW